MFIRNIKNRHMNSTNQFKKINPSGKFGYTLETFQLSALASINISLEEKNLVQGTMLTNERIFGFYNQKAEKNYKKAISEITVKYCK